jgi:hypothetical protein
LRRRRRPSPSPGSAAGTTPSRSLAARVVST